MMAAISMLLPVFSPSIMLTMSEMIWTPIQ
jgi:hypothetical protein